jgi:outer membrane immunogenic protein
MKRFFGYIAAALMLIGPVSAADLAVKARPAAAPEYPSYWDGFYLGAHAGVGWDRGAGTVSDPLGSVGVDTAPFGFVGGLHAGLGSRFGGNFYLGLEGDGDIATMDGSIQNPGFVGNVGSKSRWLASVRSRFGFILAPNLLAYGTAGWGWSGSEFTVTGTDGSRFSTTPTLNGAVAGAGLEYALGSNWGLRVEYLHYFLGDLHGNTTGILCNGTTCVGPLPLSASVTHNIGVARGGVSYHF